METLLSPFTPEFEPPQDTPPPDFFDRYRYYILGILLAVLAVGLYLMLTPPKSTITSEDAYIAKEDKGETTVTDISGQLMVDIAGGVNQPGVYQLAAGAIVEDAIDAAGGLSDLADTNEIARNINRAALVTDHSKIYIPRQGDNQIVYTNPTPYSYADTPAISSKININTADANELDTLPGIGPVTAQRIIDYRLQNGQFSSTDELKNVPGISDGKFDDLKDLITT